MTARRQFCSGDTPKHAQTPRCPDHDSPLQRHSQSTSHPSSSQPPKTPSLFDANRLQNGPPKARRSSYRYLCLPGAVVKLPQFNTVQAPDHRRLSRLHHALRHFPIRLLCAHHKLPFQRLSFRVSDCAYFTVLEALCLTDQIAPTGFPLLRLGSRVQSVNSS